MRPGVWARSVNVLSVTMAGLLWCGAGPALGDPIGWFPGFGNGLVFTNFGINGLLLLAAYSYFVDNVGRPNARGRFNFDMHFLMAVLAISLLGALVDGVVFYVEYLPATLVGAALIASFVTLTSHRHLEMTVEWAIVTGIAFFFVNVISWLLLANLWEMGPELAIILPLFFLLGLVFLILMDGVSRRYHILSNPAFVKPSSTGLELLLVNIFLLIGGIALTAWLLTY